MKASTVSPEWLDDHHACLKVEPQNRVTCTAKFAKSVLFLFVREKGRQAEGHVATKSDWEKTKFTIT